MSVNTHDLVVEEGGFLYDSDTYNEDLPYWTTVQGRKHAATSWEPDTAAQSSPSKQRKRPSTGSATTETTSAG